MRDLDYLCNIILYLQVIFCIKTFFTLFLYFLIIQEISKYSNKHSSGSFSSNDMQLGRRIGSVAFQNNYE